MSISPTSKGWIPKYFSIIHDYEAVLNQFPRTFLSPEELMYAFLQPTGFLYGHPVDFIFLENDFLNKFTYDESFKVLLLEGLVLVDYINHGKTTTNHLDETIQRFIDFYEKTELERAKKGWLDFSRMNAYEKLERIISQRVEIKGNLTSRIVTSYLYNSLLFHDLMLYQEYLNGVEPTSLRLKRSEILLDLIKIISLAAKADGTISEEEKGVFKVFMASANLDSQRKAIATEFFENGKGLNDVDFKYENSWLLKRYILEMAILTIWSNQNITENELTFLNQLTEKLGLSEEDKDTSFAAIQGFMLASQDKSIIFKGNKSFDLILNGTTQRWVKLLSRNKDKLAAELQQSKELVSLIAKSTHSELNTEEKEKVKTQFYDIAKTIPSLALFMLPGGTLILPIILKLIPDLIPSAFQPNRVEKEENKKE